MAWRYGGADPYALYNGLTPDYRPLDDPTGPPRPTQFPGRVKMFIYGLGKFANDIESGEGEKRRPSGGHA